MSDDAAATSRRQVFVVEDSLGDERVDVGVSRILGISRTRAGQLISDGLVLVRNKVPNRSDRLHVGARIEVTFRVDDESDGGEGDAEVDVLYVDDDIVVINKAVGIAAHASPGWTGPTLTGQLPRKGWTLATLGPPERQGVVHRLDVGTTGVMVLARSDRAYISLKEQFRDRDVRKTYHALVQGHPNPPAGSIDAPIGRHRQHDYRFAVVSDGKPSQTDYRTLESYPYASLLEVDLQTGRTHQIRVHMAAMKHPCCGDLTYGADPSLAARLGLTRQWLHAFRLGLDHPASGQWLEFSAPYPADLAGALDTLERQ